MCIVHGENFKSSCSRVGVRLHLLTYLFCSTSTITSTFESCSVLPMLLPLILRIVLVGNLLNYSSCLEGAKELSHEELSTSNTRGSEPLFIPPPYTSLVSAQTREKKLLAVPSKSPNFVPTAPSAQTVPTFPTYSLMTRAPTTSPAAAVPTSLPIKSTSYPTSLETLSGYYTRTAYSDSSCKALYASKSIKLNSCVRTEGRYWAVTATSSSVNIKYHFEELCTDDYHATDVIPYKNDVCVDKAKIVITPTAVVASTNATSSSK
jgi:hypothetical protein